MEQREKNERFYDELAAVVDGEADALERHADLLADSDEHRDARHEATIAARALRLAGADYEEPSDMSARVLNALDAVAAGKPTTASSDAATRSQPAVTPQKTQVLSSAGTSSSNRSIRWIALGTGLAAAAALVLGLSGVGVWMLLRPSEGSVTTATFTGQVRRIERASDDGQSGVSIQSAGQREFVAARASAALGAGDSVRTDERTRLLLSLSDGSTLVLNHETEVQLDATAPRHLRLVRGEVVADIAHLEQGPTAEITTPTGRIEVLGTKFVLAATDAMASVRVTRGVVRIVNGQGGDALVRPGEEGVLPQHGRPSVSPAIELASSLAWSELDPAEADTEDNVQGLGELRAKRPGERQDRERPLTLADHKVTIRIAGNVARTEIEEAFRNDSGETLEGIYRFPLPADARIANLSLEVDGRWEQGAFVERDRAQQIWRGVIRNATPIAERQRDEEFIWVPGPWRDPALLEWQRGGRFELRIFPIPAHGERRVRLSYTQTIAPQGTSRRYVYPLPHSGRVSQVGRFEVDARIAGLEASGAPVAHGYPLTASRDGTSATLRYTANGFTPAGDLLIDYRLPNDPTELRWWTFQGDATVPPSEQSREGNPAIVEAQRAIDADNRGYVAFALRPMLPGGTERTDRDFVIVVDSSQSMFGERFARATRVVTGVIAEMDRRDRVLVMACDATCTQMGSAPLPATSQTAEQVRSWLEAVQPAGGSDVVATLREASHVLDRSRNGDRNVHVLYVGDGMASVGHRRPSSLAAEAETLAESTGVSFSTVGVAGDADAVALATIARAGGGHYVPFVAGERASSAALAVLETTYGASLERAHIEMPDGIVELAPSELPTIRHGQEVVVVGRLANAQVQGELTLRGKIGGREFSQRYPVSFTADTTAGNAFVPAMWASRTIDQLELVGRTEDEPRIIGLSKAFGVMSHHTSLLVLESEAMFRAFGVDRAQTGLTWSGEEDVVAGESSAIGTLGTGRGAGGVGTGYSASRGDDQLARAIDPDGEAEFAEPREESSLDRMVQRVPPAATATARPSAAVPPAPNQPIDGLLNGALGGARNNNAQVPLADTAAAPSERRARRAGPGRWMRRIWYREGSVSERSMPRSQDLQSVAAADQALRMSPDSRDRHRDLVRALSRTGDLDRAREVVEKWVARDRLDAEALTYLADILGRLGHRDEAVRTLSGVVDLQPDDRTLHERLAKAFERAGMANRACAHRIALAEIQADDPNVVGAAMRCERQLGRSEGALRLLNQLPITSDSSGRRWARLNLSNREIAEAAAARPSSEAIRGDLTIDASWTSSTNLDISLITPQGTRISWMGGRTTVSGDNVEAPGNERLALRSATVGNYLVEVSRVDRDDHEPIQGELRINALGSRRTLRFDLSGPRTVVGSVDIVRRSRMESW